MAVPERIALLSPLSYATFSLRRRIGRLLTGRCIFVLHVDTVHSLEMIHRNARELIVRGGSSKQRIYRMLALIFRFRQVVQPLLLLIPAIMLE